MKNEKMNLVLASHIETRKKADNENLPFILLGKKDAYQHEQEWTVSRLLSMIKQHNMTRSHFSESDTGDMPTYIQSDSINRLPDENEVTVLTISPASDEASQRAWTVAMILAGVIDGNIQHEEEPQEQKYELTDRTQDVNGKTLYQIRALVDIDDYGIKAGDYGGWVESEANLSQGGSSWIEKNACVYDNAHVSQRGIVTGYAKVSGNAQVRGNARVENTSHVKGNSQLSGNVIVTNQALIEGNTTLLGNAMVSDNAHVSGNARVSGNATVKDDALVSDNAHVFGDALVEEGAMVLGTALAFGRTHITEEAWINGGSFNLTPYHPPLTDNLYPSPNHVLDEAHPRFDARLQEDAESNHLRARAKMTG